MLEFSTWSPSLALGTMVVGAVMQQQQQVARRETYDRGRKARGELCSLSLSLFPPAGRISQGREGSCRLTRYNKDCNAI